MLKSVIFIIVALSFIPVFEDVSRLAAKFAADGFERAEAYCFGFSGFQY